MNKRRRFKAKRVRRWFGGARANRPTFDYQTCARCGDYVMACTCLEEDEADAVDDEVGNWPPWAP